MNCPVCRTSRLSRVQYEGVQVQQCETCEGSLVRNKRLNAIKRNRDKSDRELVAEVNANTGGDSPKKLICPGCLRQMDCRKNSGRCAGV